MTDWDRLANEKYCYLTTTGRISGKPREIEIWFTLMVHGVMWDSENPGSSTTWTTYMLAEGRGRASWVRNLMADPSVSVRIGDQTFAGTARIVEDDEEEAMARRALPAKYQEGYSNDLTEWGQTALPVAVDLEV